MTPVFKNKRSVWCGELSPGKILPIYSKVYKSCMYDQIYENFNKILSKQQGGFRQGFSTQHCLLAMTEKWRKYLD